MVALAYRAVAWETDYMLILFKYIYKCLCYTRVFEMKAFLAPNNVCFWLICKLLSIKWLRLLSQKRKQNHVKNDAIPVELPRYLPHLSASFDANSSVFCVKSQRFVPRIMCLLCQDCGITAVFFPCFFIEGLTWKC